MTYSGMSWPVKSSTWMVEVFNKTHGEEYGLRTEAVRWGPCGAQYVWYGIIKAIARSLV